MANSHIEMLELEIIIIYDQVPRILSMYMVYTLHLGSMARFVTCSVLPGFP